MPNSNDFRSTQIQTNKLIVTGSNVGSAQCLLVYGHSAQGTPGEQGIINSTYFPSGAVGSDVFVYFSGAVGSRGTANPGVVAFGGDLHVSGNLTVDGTTPGGALSVWFSDTPDETYTTGSAVIRNTLGTGLSLVVSGSTVLGGLGAYATGSSVAEGEQTTASGFASHAQGQFSTASSDYSHAEGFNCLASSAYAHAEGSVTIASAPNSHAEGEGAEASGVGSHAEGSSTVASGMCAHAEGDGTLASADSAHAEGENTTASGQASHAEGASTMASGTYAHSEGNFTFATGYCAHAEGNGTTASGLASHAEGSNTFALGEWSHAEGVETTAFGTGSFAAGLGTVASGAIDGVWPQTTIQAAFGKYNQQESTALFVVGDGVDSANRHDVFRVNSGSVEVTGSFVSPQITGSLSGTFGGSPFIVGGPSITANYNDLGQWEITGSGAAKTTTVLAGVVTTVLSASTVAGYAHIDPTGYTTIELEAIGLVVSGVMGSLELYDLTDAAVVASGSWTEVAATRKTFSVAIPGSARLYELRVSKVGGSVSDYALFSGVHLVTS